MLCKHYDHTKVHQNVICKCWNILAFLQNDVQLKWSKGSSVSPTVQLYKAWFLIQSVIVQHKQLSVNIIQPFVLEMFPSFKNAFL